MGIHQNAPKLNALMEEGDIPDDAIYYPEYDKAIVGFTTKGQIVYDVDVSQSRSGSITVLSFE